MRGDAAPEGADESGEVVTRDARRVRKLRGWPTSQADRSRSATMRCTPAEFPWCPVPSSGCYRGGAAATAASFEWAKHPGVCRRVADPCARQTSLQGIWDVLLAGTHRASGSSGRVGRRREVALPFWKSGRPRAASLPDYTYSCQLSKKTLPHRPQTLRRLLSLRGSEPRDSRNSRLRRSASLKRSHSLCCLSRTRSSLLSRPTRATLGTPLAFRRRGLVMRALQRV